MPIDPDLMTAAATLLQGIDWTARFTPATIARGKQIFASKSVVLKSVAPGDLPGGIQMMAVVRSQSLDLSRYHAHVELIPLAHGLLLDCHCSCPVGHQCKHAAASILELLQQAAVDLSTRATAPRPAADTGERATIMARLRQESAALGFDIDELFPGVARSPAKRLAPPDPVASGALPNPADSGNLSAWNAWLARQQAPIEHKSRYELRYQLKVTHQRLTVQVLGRKNQPGKRGRSDAFKTLPDLLSGAIGDPWSEIEDQDQALLRQVLSAPRTRPYSEYRALIGRQGRETLAGLLQHGCLWSGTAAVAPRVAAPRTGRATWELQEDGSQRLQAAIEPAAEMVILDGLWYADPRSGELGPVTGMSASEFDQIGSAPVLRPAVLAAVANQLSAALPRLPAPFSAEQRECSQLSGSRLTIVPTIAYASQSAQSFGARLGFQYDDVLVDASELRDTLARVDGGVRTAVTRDRRGEQRWIDTLRALDMVNLAERLFGFAPLWLSRVHPATPESWLELAEPLRAAGFEVVFGEEFPLRLVAEPKEWFAELESNEGSPWFDLELGIRIGEEKVSLLPILVKALASKSLSMTPSPQEAPDATWLAPIDERRRVRLPLARVRTLVAPILEWLDQLGRGRALKLPMLRADLAETYGELDISVRAAATLKQLGQAIKSGYDGARIEVPAALKATLRDYQIDGITWLDFLARHHLGGLLADDMGLGKTVQVLAHVLSEKAAGRIKKPVLIVMPTSLVPNWQAEAARFAPDLKLLTLHGSTRKGYYGRGSEYDLILTTYALLSRDFDVLTQIHFDLVVFDEAQALKNPQAKAAQFARRLKCARRLVMTGTPLENHLGELWAQVDLVLPGLLGERREFTTHFRTPIEKHQDAHQRERLTRRLKPFLLRRTKQQVARELPPKTEIIQRIELEGPQREVYESLRLAMHDKVRKAIKARGVSQSSIVVLDALLKLRQVCCDPALVKLPTAVKQRQSAKRAALMELLEPLLSEGRRVLLFSQFTEMLDLIQHELEAKFIQYVRLDGSTRDRAAPVAAFQSERVPLMLISLKAGGVGLNLTAADTVIHYDPWWNPAVENQATDRAHRIGQNKPVFVYKLVCTDTVEDKIIALQARKAELANAILDGGASSSLQFDEATIEELLGRG